MNLYDFLSLTQERKEIVVWTQGNLLIVRQHREYSMYLYFIGNFFAEVLHRLADNQIVLIRGFKSKFGLDPYLEMVDLSDILNALDE